ncbi:prepilin peptidase [Patescibacteria group bacterium]|nr:prepilin peptidase [Patescibacteria group bacterium]
MNSWTWRHWENIRITSGRSICIHCHRQLAWYENIPLFSYVFLGGKCRTCGKKIPWFYTLVEIFMAVAFVFIAWYRLNIGHFTPLLFTRDIFFITILMIIFVFDGLHKVILPHIVWLGAIVGLALNLLFFHFSFSSIFFGALAAGGFFLLQFLVSKGRWIGGGDVRMGVMMGVWVGWPAVLVALLAAYVLGGVVGAALLIAGKKKIQSQIPFGTFLSVGTVIAIYYGDEIVRWYISFIK